MCKQHLILAAVLAVGGMAFTGCGKQEAATDTNSNAAPATQQTTGQKIGSMIDATTQKVTDAATQASGVVSSTGADSVQGAKNAVQKVTETATERNTFRDVAGYLTKADADRIAGSKPETKDLDDLAEAFNVAYKAKYGYSFKVKDPSADFPDSFIQVVQDTSDPTKASATLMTSTGNLVIPFLREGSQWKIDVPDNVDGQTLHDNLVAAFTALNKAAPSWPDSDAAAIQVVTRTIMAAILNQK